MTYRPIKKYFPENALDAVRVATTSTNNLVWYDTTTMARIKRNFRPTFRSSKPIDPSRIKQNYQNGLPQTNIK